MQEVIFLGASGQLGQQFQHKLSSLALTPDFNFRFYSSSECDITKEQDLRLVLASSSTPIVVNCAAYTQVDLAEVERAKANRTNHFGLAIIADLLTEFSACMIHLSTDYVFDGSSLSAYSPSDPISPLSVYGATKALGEAALLTTGRALILRTSSVYSSYGVNFYRKIREQLLQDQPLRVVDDQFCTPTWAGWLSRVIAHHIRSWRPGIAHAVSPDSCSWYQFACEIARQLGYPPNRVLPISTAQLKELMENRPYAQRPKRSVITHDNSLLMHSSALENCRLLNESSWRDQLKRCIAAESAVEN